MSQQVPVFREIKFLGAGTGVHNIVLMTNLADSLSIKDSAADIIVFATTTGSPTVTITPATTITGILTSNGGITFGDAKNIITNATTGTKIGTAVTQKIGFWNATPVVQQAHIAAATDAATVITRANAIILALETEGLLAAA